MKVGDLCRVLDDAEVPPLISAGDLAILTHVDWDHRSDPDGIIDSRGRKITGRGFFFFPAKPEVQHKYKRDGRHIGVMLLFNNFEVISEAG